jgi:hypothetical protein
MQGQWKKKISIDDLNRLLSERPKYDFEDCLKTRNECIQNKLNPPHPCKVDGYSNMATPIY